MQKHILYIAICFLGVTFFVFGIRKYIHRLPAGPYQTSCQKCFIVNGTLDCQCHKHDDEWASETLENANDCLYSIVNDHGELKCLPNGSYLYSCARCWMSGDTLYCRACKNRQRQTVQLLEYFSLPHVSTCRYDIVNNNAELNCLPPGPYLKNCSKCYIKDDILHCQCSTTPNQKRTLHPSSIDLKTCPNGTIHYYGGILECIN